jgi:hypothetical protein
MIMKKIGCFLAAVFLGLSITSANAQEPPAKAKDEPIKTVWTGTWTTSTYSRYINISNTAVNADEPVVQSELDINWEHGNFSGSFMVWGSKGFKSNWRTSSDEFDFGAKVAHSGPIDVSVSYWRLVLVPDAGSDVNNVVLEASKTFAPNKRDSFTPSLKLDMYWPDSTNGPRAGKFVNVSLLYERALSERVSLVNQAQYARDLNGALGYRPRTNLYRYDGGIDVSVGNGWTLSPRIIYAGSWGDPDRPGKLTLGFSASKNFSLSKPETTP